MELTVIINNTLKMDKKTVIIILLSIACLILGYLAFHSTPVPMDDKFLQARYDTLQNANNRLLKEITEEHTKSIIYKRKSDSLGQLPPKIQIQYVKLYKKNDNASNAALLNSFDTIFSNAGIK